MYLFLSTLFYLRGKCKQEYPIKSCEVGKDQHCPSIFKIQTCANTITILMAYIIYIVCYDKIVSFLL